MSCFVDYKKRKIKLLSNEYISRYFTTYEIFRYNMIKLFAAPDETLKSVFPTAAVGDSLDWKELSADEIYARVMKRVKPGSIMLFHNGAKHTPEALKKLLPALINEGYKIVPISELIYNDDYTIDHAGTQKRLSQTEDNVEN